MARAAKLRGPCLGSLHYLLIEPDRKEHLALLSLLFLHCRFDLIFDPGACNGMLGEQEQQFVMQMDRFINASTDLFADLHILWRKPAAHALILEIGVQATSKHVVFARVANETRVILNR